MSAQRLLYLDAAGLAAYAWRAGQIEPLGHFPAGEAGLAQFQTFLTSQPAHSLYTLLADQVEEAFHHETLPCVRGADRAAMLARKRGQYLFGSPYATELSLGREAGGRRDERFLFVGLTRPATLEPWLEALSQAEAPLTGIHTLPLLADAMPSPFGQRGEAARLIMVLTPAGIRQIFLEKGRLRFSRLSTRLDDSLEALAATLAEEASRTQAYLTSQRLIPRNEALAVTVLATPADAQVLAPRLQAPSQTHFEFADLAALGQGIGLASPCQGSDALPVFLHWMARAPRRVQLAPPAPRRFYRLHQARLAAIGFGTAVFLGCLVVAAKLWVDNRQLQQQIDQISLQTRADRGRFEALIATLPPLPAPLERLQDVMARIDRQAQAPADLRPALASLATALDEHPDLKLEALSWHALPPGAGEPPDRRVEVEARLRFPPGRQEDRRSLVSQSEALAAQLRRPPALTVQVTRMPIELESDRTLRGGGEPTPGAEGPLLELRFTLPGALGS